MYAPIHPESPPPGYPVELETEVSLDDGTRAHLRPVVPDDADILAHEISTADPETSICGFSRRRCGQTVRRWNGSPSWTI
jgi:hypothetical protein